MRAARVLRIFLGIIAAILACWSCVGIPGSFLVPGADTGTVAGDLVVHLPFAILMAAITVGFAFLARWCFTGRGFKRRKKEEFEQ
jgi:hypothetical protein